MIRSLPGGRWLHGAGLACVLLLLPGVLPADGLSVDEQAAVARSRVEAAYLFKFTDFVTWPEQSFAAGDSPIVVTVVADESLARDLELAAAGKQVQGRSLRVSRHAPGELLPDSHVLFIGADAREHAPDLLRKVHGRPVLTVSNHPDVHAHGTMVNFVIVNERVRFDVALRQARDAGVHISALMLTAARTVARAGR
mgnify:CR=1 FL=1